MRDRLLRLVVRTPHECAFDRRVRSVRVLAESGQVGLRPGMEALALAVEPGLIVVRSDSGLAFVGSAGGLLACDGQEAVLYTPLAVSGPDAPTVRAAVDRALAAPDAELKLHAALDRLEGRILRELRRSAGAPASRVGEPR
jgi:F0F1-type ATP synthase epsilon subunit